MAANAEEVKFEARGVTVIIQPRTMAEINEAIETSTAEPFSRVTRNLYEALDLIRGNPKILVADKAKLQDLWIESFARMAVGYKQKVTKSLREQSEVSRKLAEEVATIKNGVQTLTDSGPSTSYSSAVKTKDGAKEDRPSFVVVLEPKKRLKEQEARKITERCIQPGRNTHINSWRLTKQGKVVLDLSTQEDAASIVQNKELQAHFKITEKERRLPQLIIYDVNDVEDESQLIKDIKTLNGLEEGSTLTLRFKTGPRDREKSHWVVEVDPDTRKKLLAQGRVYLYLYTAKVRDYLTVTKCVKCNEFGHVAKYCTNEEVCAKCGEANHKRKDCKNEKRCIPCHRRKIKCKGGDKYPSRTQAMKRQKSSTDYGN